MKLLLTLSLFLMTAIQAKAQCFVSVNDSLMVNYDYSLAAANEIGTAPFSYMWAVSDGNGNSVPFINYGDSIVIEANTLINAYGCIIYSLCMQDFTGCITCSTDTSALQVPFNCFSSFGTSIISNNQVSVTSLSTIPPFLVVNQFLNWTDGNGQGQGMPYFGPGTIINYTPGPDNPSNQFLLCMMTQMVNGGCLHCDSIPYTNSGLGILENVKTDFSIFPNPATDILNIQTNEMNYTVTLTNMQGQLIGTFENPISLNSSNYNPGIYFVKMVTPEGKSTVQKLTIEK